MQLMTKRSWFQMAHFGSFTSEWTFDKQADTVSKRSAPFWRSFAASPRQYVCSCSALIPKTVDEGAEVKATDSGLLFLRRLAGGENTKV